MTACVSEICVFIARASRDTCAAKSALDQDATAAVGAKTAAEESSVITKKLADKAETLEAKLNAYEIELTRLQKESVKQLETIQSLLPEATSAGLASAFDERRRGFKAPYIVWQCIFVVAVLVIVILTALGLWHVFTSGQVPTSEELLRLWLTRLPVVGALVWLAIHASHESALAKRLEEDYGYKVAISRCLEGFKKQMSDVEEDVTTNTPLGKLLSNTLETIAAPPGRIYDKHELSASLSREVARIAKAAAEAARAGKTPPA